ncbi:hypothetical protein ACV229_26540 [Burkholderia sp. MR1-5-21]
MDNTQSDGLDAESRCTVLMLEQAIKQVVMSYASGANNATTWVAVQNSISDLLLKQWNAGVLVGTTAQDSFRVTIGLGSTMTPDDVMNRCMRGTVFLAVNGPDEFTEVTFQQSMQS